MKRFLALSLALASVAVFLSGCDLISQLFGVAVSGTVSGTGMQLSSAQVLFTQGTDTYGESVSIPAGSSQSASYTTIKVPKGTYDLSATVSSATSGSCVALEYAVNDGATVTPTLQLNSVFNGTDYDYSFTATGLSIQSDTTVDVVAYTNPC